MGFLDRLKGKAPIRDLGGGKSAVTAVMLNGGGDVNVVGEAHYQGELDRICGGKSEEGHSRAVVAALVREPSNPYDKNAVAVHVDGMKVGHLSRDDAIEYGPLLAQLANRHMVGACEGVIRGGWDRGGTDTGHYGVFLDLAAPDQADPG